MTQGRSAGSILVAGEAQRDHAQVVTIRRSKARDGLGRVNCGDGPDMESHSRIDNPGNDRTPGTIKKVNNG